MLNKKIQFEYFEDFACLIGAIAEKHGVRNRVYEDDGKFIGELMGLRVVARSGSTRATVNWGDHHTAMVDLDVIAEKYMSLVA